MKKIFSVFFSLLFVITIFNVLLCSIKASALTFNGAASGSASISTSAGGSYAIPTNMTGGNRPSGYRFSVVDKNGSQVYTPYDLFNYAVASADNVRYIDYQKYLNKYCKTELKTRYSYTSFDTSSTTTNVAYDVDKGVSLPEYTTDVATWCTYENINSMLDYCYAISVRTLEENSWAILIEPIYSIKLEGVYHSLTVTETAVYGASKFGASTIPASSGNTGSWALISNFTNRYHPNSLRLSSSYINLSAPSALSSRISFASIIDEGYGAAVVYGEYTNNYSLTINYYSNYADTSFAEPLNAVGGDKNVLVRTWEVDSSGSGWYSGGDNLHDYTSSVSSTYLAKIGHTSTGYWNTKADGSGTSIHQATNYTLPSDLAAAFGKDLHSGNVTINLYAQWSVNTVQIAYHPNGGTTTSPLNEWGWIMRNGETYFHTLKYGDKDDPYNTSTLNLTRPGYTFAGWKVHSTGVVLDQDTEYASTVYAHYDDPLKTTAGMNLNTVYCYLYAQWDNTPPGFKDKNGNWADNGETTIHVGTVFDPMAYVTAEDSEDGDITSNIVVTDNNVPVDQSDDTVTTVGQYTVKYSVTDLGGATGTYTLTVNVIDESAPSQMSGYLRFIRFDLIETLSENSKWRREPLKDILTTVLSANLKNTSGCEQVWHFTVDDTKKAREWCLSKNKGRATNIEFLDRFKANKIK